MEVDFARRHTTLGSLAIAAALAFVAFGLPWIDRSVSGAEKLEPGIYYRVGGGIEILPPAGALLDAGISRSNENSGCASFVLENRELRYSVTVDGYAESVSAAAARLLRRLNRVPGAQIRSDQVTTWTTAGVVGRQGSFTVAPEKGTGDRVRLGRYAVFVTDGPHTVDVVVLGRADLVRREAPMIESTFASVRLGRAP